VSFDIDSGDEVEESLQSCWAFDGHPLMGTDQCTFDCKQLVLGELSRFGFALLFNQREQFLHD